jgi:lycopene cyclase CruA
LLHDPATWAMLPTQAERLGQMWRWGDDLYTLTFSDTAPDHLIWRADSAAATGAALQVELRLHDAIISTHVQVRVTLSGAAARWPWQALLDRWRLHMVARACTAALSELLRAQPRVAAAAEPVAVPVGAQPADDTPAPPEAHPATNGRLPAAMPLFEQLRDRYPQTAAHFAEMGAAEHLERLWHLERGWERILRGEYDETVYERRAARPDLPPPEYDLVYAGGGLGLLHAVVMAQCYGRRVLLFDRSEVGCVHREWNISRGELRALVDMGLVTWDELAPVMMREYNAGLVKFHTGPASRVSESELWFPEVLNVAIDAGGLLRLMRRKLEQAGGVILDRRSFRCVRVYDNRPPHVEVVLESMTTGAEEVYHTRLLLDGMGSTSPLALLRHAGQPFAGVCPTVGTVVSGLVPGTARDEFDPTIGDILISVDDAQDGRQMIWEGFPGRGDELTVYVFYYAALKNYGRSFEPPPPVVTEPGDPPPRYSLLALFEHYFALLPSYKKPGPDFRHVKPVYGYIPGRHSVDMHDSPLLRGVLPVGDAAAQQSPLTYCGFGSHVRNLHRTTSLLDYALRRNLLEPGHLRHSTAFQVNVSLNWVFSRFMQPWGYPHGVNEIQNAFLDALNDLGLDVATRFFRDRMRWHDYNRIVWASMMRYKVVFVIVWPVLGLRGVWQWLNDYVRFSAASAAGVVGRRLGPRGERVLTSLAERISPALGLRVRARYAEWRAMGWISGADW